MKKTITRSDLADAVHRRIGLSRNEASLLVQAVLDEIVNTTIRGESVKLSCFATFHVKDKKLRIGRNPKTGVEVPITPRKVIRFKASNVLKERICVTQENIN